MDLDVLDRSVTSAIAVPLKHAAAERELLARAHARDLGVVHPGQAWLNQLPPAERGAAFAALPYALGAPFDPDSARLGHAALRDYAEAYLEAQLLAGATLVTTPAHILAAEGGPARAQELALAEAAVDAWHERQGRRPPPDRPDAPPRALYATVAVRGRDVAAAAADLADAYADLDVDGYWVVLLNGSKAARQLAGVTQLALALQQRTDRPVTVNGAAGLHVALLASGVAATCAGLHGMRPTFPPVHDERPVTVYHPAILSPIPDGAAYDAVRNRLFALQPCACGRHDPARPPRGPREIVAHNTACLEQETREATFMAPAIDEQRLLARVERANRLRRSLQLSDLPRGWTAVAAAARAVRAGEDLAGEG